MALITCIALSIYLQGFQHLHIRHFLIDESLQMTENIWINIDNANVDDFKHLQPHSLLLFVTCLCYWHRAGACNVAVKAAALLGVPRSWKNKVGAKPLGDRWTTLPWCTSKVHPSYSCACDHLVQSLHALLHPGCSTDFQLVACLMSSQLHKLFTAHAAWKYVHACAITPVQVPCWRMTCLAAALVLIGITCTNAQNRFLLASECCDTLYCSNGKVMSGSIKLSCAGVYIHICAVWACWFLLNADSFPAHVPPCDLNFK